MNLLLVTGANGMLGQTLVEYYGASVQFDEIISIDIANKDGPLSKKEFFYKLDITNELSVQGFFDELLSERSDVQRISLINCAGISVFADYGIRTKSDFMKVLEVNLYGTFNMSQKLINLALENRIECNIVNTSSLFGSRSPDERNYVDLDRKNSEVYGASKAGVEQMTRYLAAHLGKHNIRVNCVSPGGILNEDSPQGEKFQELYNYKVPLARMGKLSEMIGAFDLLLSEEKASYITGQIINIDGGYTSW